MSGTTGRSGIIHHLILRVELVEFDSTHGGLEGIHVGILAAGQSEVDVGL